MEATAKNPLPHAPVWTDIINDFLEIACLLGPSQRQYFLKELSEEGIRCEGIRSYPAFAADGRLVIVVPGTGDFEHCWLYYAEKPHIRKMPLNRS